MIDVKEMFERQARWQQSRARLSWMEKLRMSETLRLAAHDDGERKNEREPPRGLGIRGRPTRSGRSPRAFRPNLNLRALVERFRK